MTAVERLYLYVPGLVGVFRQCRECQRWLQLGNFTGTKKRGFGHRCKMCATPLGRIGNRTSKRTMQITPEGRAALRRAGL